MARNDIRYRQAHNRLLDACATLGPGAALPSEQVLAELAGVSRTVVRRCLTRLVDLGIIVWQGRDKHLMRLPDPGDRLALDGGDNGRDQLEQRFLDWVLRFDVPADTALSVAELSRNFGVAQHDLKEFLAGLSRFGLVARRPRGGWMLRGFTKDFAIELSDFRLVLELDAIAKLAEAPVDHPVWQRLSALRAAHLALAERIETDFHEFPKLDEAFHEALNSVVRNRFVAESQKVISLIFHYHYMWDKTEEKSRNRAAIQEHLAIIDALEARDAGRAAEAARRHLRTSKSTLLSSLRHHDLG
ncbi:GntR family transcriptional regulator [Paracoccus nototheniae]|uniref:FCD domain-containing protein n=1 Tax=Paracoccus nototheniae TaxID=2489002 RepID=A0ABW4DWE2_9RHOB|nr:GntR family transcriptional regulator [Paracoccus nototheniae]